jgi:hypothetical protein
MLKTLLLYASGKANQTISYQQGWPKYFLDSAFFDCVAINLMATSRVEKARNLFQVLLKRKFDVIILLHSVFSNSCYLQGTLLKQIQKNNAPKVYFIGNEYKLIPEKMDFCTQLPVRFFVTQKSDPKAQALYQKRLGCKVIGLPGAGLDSDIFYPQLPYADRPIDIGFRAYNEPLYFGHQERRDLADHFLKKQAENWVLDIAMDHEQRFSQIDYAYFLNQCKAQLATEAGKDYMELDDSIRLQTNAFLAQHSNVTIQDIQKAIFNNLPPSPSGRSISGRNIEAAGTKTLQIMFVGHYSGYFKPNQHYLSIAKDFSNINQVLEQFKDPKVCTEIIENAFEVVVQQLTYAALGNRFYQALIETI